MHFIRWLKMGKRGQNWSTDAIIAIVIFMVILLSFFYITGKSLLKKDLDSYGREAAMIPEFFQKSENESLRFIDDNKVDSKKLDQLVAMDYDALKVMLGVSNDFCIHFEDEKGNLVFINITNNVTGLGSPKALISNVSCS